MRAGRRSRGEAVRAPGRSRVDDVVLNTVASIERCGARVREEYADNEANLRGAEQLPANLAERMARMVGFRNSAVRNYRTLDLQIVKSLVTTRLDDFLDAGGAGRGVVSRRSWPGCRSCRRRVDSTIQRRPGPPHDAERLVLEPRAEVWRWW